MSFKVHKDQVFDNSLSVNTSIGTLRSAGHESTPFSPNSDTILVSDILECDGGLLKPGSLAPNANSVIIDSDSGRTLIPSGSSNITLTFDKNLSSGSFGRIIFINVAGGTEITIDAGENNDFVGNRFLIGYFNNDGVITPVRTFSENLKYTSPADATENSSSVVKWHKVLNSRILIECETGATTTPFSLVAK